jgi:rRNA maturation protein Nop10
MHCFAAAERGQNMNTYSCPKCGTVLESPSSLAGQYDECPMCGSKTVVPGPRKFTRRFWWALGAVAGLILVACAAVLVWQSTQQVPAPATKGAQVQAEAAPIPPTPNVQYPTTTLLIEPGVSRLHDKTGNKMVFVPSAIISPATKTKNSLLGVDVPLEQQGKTVGALISVKNYPLFVTGFYIDKTEVTNHAYARYLNATGRKPPS